MKPKYKIITDIYRSRILDRKTLKRWKLPSETKLMEEFKVSRQTVRRALAELNRMGLVEARQGSGVYSTKGKPKRFKIAYITFSLDTYIFPRIIKGMSEELYLQKSDLLLYHTDYSVKKEKSILLSLAEIDGIIITPCRSMQGETNEKILKAMDASGTPVILLDNYFTADSFTTVAMDDNEGGNNAAAALYNAGHRRITIFYGQEHFGMIRRMEGAVTFLEQKGLIQGRELFSHPCSLLGPEKESEECFNTIIRSGSTAVFCTNDQLAHAILLTAENRGLAVPGKLSIIGFDNSELAAISRTPFSSMTHPKAVSGKTAVQAVLNRIRTPEEDTQLTALFHSRLINRGSVKKP